LNHYHNVMVEMDNERFDVILADKFKGVRYEPLIDRLTSYSWSVIFLSDVFWIYKYKCLVTNHYFGGETVEQSSFIYRFAYLIIQSINHFLPFLGIKKIVQIKKQYFQNIMGKYNIRFMYGADVGGEKFGSWNNLFDLFFCHGPNDSKMIKDMFDKPVYEMGYPRYDGYFNSNKNIIEIKNKFNCDNDKKTISWICTVSEYFSTIETYYLAMKELASDYNIIIRPHPLEIDKQYDRYNETVHKIVTSDNFILNDDSFQDMVELYQISDFIVCDYGGTIFSALYMEKNILLLNHNSVHKDLGIYTSTSMDVRNYLLNINQQDSYKIKEYLQDDELWKKSHKRMQEARSLYFGDHYGDSATKAAEKLIILLENNH
jgi:hypothetical protein